MARDVPFYGKHRDSGGATCNIMAFGGTGDGTADERTALTDTEAAGNDCTMPEGDYRVGGAHTLAKHWRVNRGVSILPVGALTITGQFKAGLYQVFDYSLGGTVDMNAARVPVIYAEWFGADPTGATDSTTAVERAIAASNGGPTVTFGPGTFIVDGLVVSTAGTRLNIPANTTLKLPVANSDTWMMRVIASGFRIRGKGVLDGNRANVLVANGQKMIRIDGNAAGAHISDIVCEGLEIKEFPGEDAIYVTGSASNRVSNARFSNLYLHDGDRSGLVIIDGTDIRIRDVFGHDVDTGVDLEPNVAGEGIDNIKAVGIDFWDCGSVCHMAGTDLTFSDITGRDLTDSGVVFATNSTRATLANVSITNATLYGVNNTGMSAVCMTNINTYNCASGGVRLSARNQLRGGTIRGCGTTAVIVAAAGECIIDGMYLWNETGSGELMVNGVDLNGTGLNTVSNIRTRGIADANVIVNNSISPNTNIVFNVPGQSHRVVQVAMHNMVLPNDSTANRPSAPIRGQPFWDVTLGKPIVYNGTAWSVVPVALTAAATYNPPSLNNATQQSTTVTVTGAAMGDRAACSFSLALQGTRMWAEVTAADTVTVYHRNDTGGALDIGSGTLRVEVFKQ